MQEEIRKMVSAQGLRGLVLKTRITSDEYIFFLALFSNYATRHRNGFIIRETVPVFIHCFVCPF